ncbi:MAG TPA: ribosome maturation factor RimP [Mycobacteriales bacterium]|jgi:ribosome maturation factor RimP|nr:ribosome maturation factor RimP [Mycobacteriales bacterium]
MSTAAAAQLRSVLDPIVTAAGLDLEEVVVRPAGSRRLVQVVVDKDGGIQLDDVAEISRACSEALDSTDVVKGAYVLEVTSPGVDRPLTEPRHWRRNVGRLVEVRRRDGTKVTGRVTAAHGHSVHLDVGGDVQTIQLPDVAKGVVQVEFNRPGGPVGDEPDGLDDEDQPDQDGADRDDQDDEEAGQ